MNGFSHKLSITAITLKHFIQLERTWAVPSIISERLARDCNNVYLQGHRVTIKKLYIIIFTKKECQTRLEHTLCCLIIVSTEFSHG